MTYCVLSVLHRTGDWYFQESLGWRRRRNEWKWQWRRRRNCKQQRRRRRALRIYNLTPMLRILRSHSRSCLLRECEHMGSTSNEKKYRPVLKTYLLHVLMPKTFRLPAFVPHTFFFLGTHNTSKERSEYSVFTMNPWMLLRYVEHSYSKF